MGFFRNDAELARLCERHGHRLHRPHGRADRSGRRTSCGPAPQRKPWRSRWLPGGAVDSVDAAMSAARLIGTPLLVKAVGGGGGRGMKRIERLAELPAAIALAAAEAGAAFGDARVYLERFVTRGAPYRGAGSRRWRRTRDPPGRARLLGPAPLSETDRGIARTRIARTPVSPSARGRRALRGAPYLSRRRHGGVPGRRARRRFIFSR